MNIYSVMEKLNKTDISVESVAYGFPVDFDCECACGGPGKTAAIFFGRDYDDDCGGECVCDFDCECDYDDDCYGNEND